MTKYDDVAVEFDAYESEATTDAVLGHANIVKLLGSCSGLNILEYGCGTGKVCRYLAARGARVTGVDISAKEIEIARTKGDGIAYQTIESANLSGLPDNFDAIVFSFVLCTIASRDELEKILSACAEKLRRDGRVVILNNNPEESHGREFLSFSMDHLERTTSGQPFKTRLGADRQLVVDDILWSEQDYVQMMSQSGLVTETVIQPLATGGKNWRDETRFPPFKLFLARKT